MPLRLIYIIINFPFPVSFLINKLLDTSSLSWTLRRKSNEKQLLFLFYLDNVNLRYQNEIIQFWIIRIVSN